MRSGDSAFGQAVPVAAVRAGDVVVDPQRFANAHRDSLFAAVKMRQAGHQSAGVEFVHLLFKQANPHHLPVGTQPLAFSSAGFAASFRLGSSGGHFLPPAVTGRRHAGHRRQHVEHAGKIVLRPSHAAGGRKKFVADRRGRQGHIELAAQIHRQHHVFLHHVHVEPGFFGLLQNEWPAVLNHRRSDGAVREHIDRDFAGDAALLRQQHAFGKCQHLHRQTQVGGDLHGERQAVVADVRHLRADVEQQRLYLFEGLSASARPSPRACLAAA